MQNLKIDFPKNYILFHSQSILPFGVLIVTLIFRKEKKIIFVGNDSNRDSIMVKEIAKIMSDINFLVVSKIHYLAI